MRARVAVIIPCFNDGALVQQAVGSIQEREPVELVVIDDGSSDPATAKVLERLASEGIRMIHHDVNKGLSAARTTGVRSTEAPYVFPLDADDLAMPRVLATMADRLDTHPEAIACSVIMRSSALRPSGGRSP